MSTTDTFNYLTLGYDCSPAAALRNLNLRNYALPFDWVQSNLVSLEQCFKDNFSKYHTNLRYNHTGSRLIDAYGFQFPHDYPLMDMSANETTNIGEGVFGEEQGKYITPDWPTHYPIVKEKYERRIGRFLDILKDPKPIIVLCRYDVRGAVMLKCLLHKYYNRGDVYIINSTPEDRYVNDTIINCHTEKNGQWNETAIWKEAIDKATAHYMTATATAMTL